MCVGLLKLPIAPAGLSCLSSKVFSNNIAVSEELASATGQQMFDLKTSACPFVYYPQRQTLVSSKGRHDPLRPEGQGGDIFTQRAFQKVHLVSLHLSLHLFVESACNS